MFEIPDNRDDIFSVIEITRHVKHMIESNIPQVMVEGEIANFVKHGSGHLYFSLKDSEAVLRCVFFRPQNLSLSFAPRDGDRVVCSGKLGVYEKSGSYQLTVSRCMLSGLGVLQAQLEKLKRRLYDEGLFDPARKRPLPPYPRCIGVITSATGAAFQDICNILRRRWPCEIHLFPAAVQGVNAVAEILRGLDYFQRQEEVDVLIVGRGGGSQEDLLSFNDESLVRAIAVHRTPVISAVGHEIDFTLTDLAADLRAPTPSAAAELATPDCNEVRDSLHECGKRLAQFARMNIRDLAERLTQAKTDLKEQHPRYRLQMIQQRLDEIETGLRRFPARFPQYRSRLEFLRTRLQAEARNAAWRSYNLREREVRELHREMFVVVSAILSTLRNRLHANHTRLEVFSPRDALKRGYAILRQAGMMVRSIQQIDPESPLNIHLKDGTCRCRVTEIEDSPPFS